MHTANGKIAFCELYSENWPRPDVNSITKQFGLQSSRFKMLLCSDRTCPTDLIFIRCT